MTEDVVIGDAPATTTADVLTIVGALVQNTGVSFICHGDILIAPTVALNGTWDLNGSASFLHGGDFRVRFDGTTTIPAGLTITGTSADRATFGATPGGSTYLVSVAGDASTDIIDIAVNYCDFIRCDGNTQTFISQSNNGYSGTISFNECLFDTCGRIVFGDAVSTVPADAVFEVTNGHFVNPSHESLIEYNCDDAFNVGTRKATGISAVGTATLNQIYIGALIHTINDPFVISGVLQDVRVNNAFGGPIDVSVATRFKLYDSTNNEIFCSKGSGKGNSVIHDSYCYSDRTDPNCFSFGDDTCEDNILETTQSAGNMLLFSGGVSAATVQHNITIGGNGIAQIGGGSGTVLIENNTHVMSAGNFDCHLLSEGTVWTANLITFRSNLVVGVGTGDFGISSITATQDLAYTDYNCIYNVADHYSSVTVANNTLTEGVSAGFGASDITNAPLFTDGTASITTWDTSLGGLGTVDNAFAEMLKLNGFDAAGAPATFDVDYNLADLLFYMRNAYMPTEVALSGTGFGGADIGAVTLGETFEVTLDDLSMGTLLDAVSLSLSNELAATDLTLAVSIDAPALDTIVEVAPADLTLALTFDAPILEAAVQLAIEDLLQAVSMDSAALTTSDELAISKLSFAANLDNVELKSTTRLTPADLTMGMKVDQLVIYAGPAEGDYSQKPTIRVVTEQPSFRVTGSNL